ncbi:MAG: protein kinase [Candidatus Eisenbacteria bacterium]|uniref:Protein kinase n=1 Tax=Eiseniibacteriota bacterium TaxID=2212470 RepID=A0A956SFN5_UNCEI|nr:protein kinase [Candidatus Eisenbacteria bacterium]
MIGQTLAHYRILSALGSGGMGVVYRARDTRLDRDVALKLLPPAVASHAESRERFQREARLLASLDHPNIVTVYSVEEAGGLHFLTMGLIEGRTLDDVIPADGLSLAEILRVSVALVDALAAAHDKGVIHRDIKPGNVMVTPEGRIKVLDFGLAKSQPMGTKATRGSSALPEGETSHGSAHGSEHGSTHDAADGSTHDAADGAPLDPSYDRSRGPSLDDVTVLQTTPGTLVGTVPYMSPEQVECLEVDVRTDIFSFGIVLYEMATGRRPFQGASPAGLASSILRDDPPAIAEFRKDLPDDYARLVRHCLEKSRDRRPQRLAEVGKELESIRDAASGNVGGGVAAGGGAAGPGASAAGGGVGAAGAGAALAAGTAGAGAVGAADAAGADSAHSAASTSRSGDPNSGGDDRSVSGTFHTTHERSIAVLPFTNLSSSADDEYFSDGITEEIMIALGRIDGLRVAARTSSFAFKDERENLQVVGETLRVRTVLEGSVRRAGNRLRITAQLVDVATGYHLWSERYDREMTDIFEIQDDIAGAIASKLELGFASSGGGQTVRRGTSDLEAFDLYLRALALQSQRARAVYQAMSLLERAIERDPDYADAHALLAESHRLLATYGLEHPNASMPRAKASAERALQIDPAAAEALSTLGTITAQFDRDHAAAFDYWEQALRANPGLTRARSERAAWALCTSMSSTPQAVEEILVEVRRAVDLDPLNVTAISMRSLTLGLAGRAEEAVPTAARAVELHPDSYLSRYVLVQCNAWSGRYDQAIQEARAILPMFGRHTWTLGALGVAYANAGRPELAEAVYDELEARHRQDYVPPFSLANVASALGRIDDMRMWTKRAVDERDPMVVFVTRWPGLSENLRKHVDYPAFLESIGIR